MAKSEDKQKIEVNPNTIIGSTYSQMVSVSVTDIDVTLEFVFINPRDKRGQVVSRVTLPRPAGEQLAKAVFDTIKLHETKKKGHKND